MQQEVSHNNVRSFLPIFHILNQISKYIQYVIYYYIKMMCKCIGIHNSAILKIITIKKNGCAVAWAIRFINSVYSFFISLSSQLKFHHQTINVLCLQWNNIDPASQKDTGPIAWLHMPFHVAAHIYSIGRMRIVMQLQFHMTPSTTYAPHYGISSHFHSKISRIHKFRAFVFSLAFRSGQWICLNFELKTSSLVSKNSISIYVESQLN